MGLTSGPDAAFKSYIAALVFVHLGDKMADFQSSLLHFLSGFISFLSFQEFSKPSSPPILQWDAG